MRLKIFIIAILLMVVALAGGIWWLFGQPANTSQPQVFVLREDAGGFFVADDLKKEQLIKNAEAWRWLYIILVGDRKVLAGGYRLNRNMNAWEILQQITGRPQLVWVTIPEGMRKEQIGEKLSEKLGWSEDQNRNWKELYTLDNQPEYAEGVYFPDTYLLPLDESVEQIAQRFIDRFNEKFAPFFDQFLARDIKWTTGLKIASLIQREAAGPQDMPLISGIIWNRLTQEMKLEIDATMQYTLGKTNGSWWGPVDLAEKRSDSPYNTYLYKGLPPTPISNPGLVAIDAALNPAETDCLYYLHDPEKQIHCATTYAQHLQNIREFLN